jgi:hypothetical protein
LCQFQLTKWSQLESELEEPGSEQPDFKLENWKPAQVPNTHLIRKKSSNLNIWFSMCSQKHKSMVEDLHFISGLQPDLAKSS